MEQQEKLEIGVVVQYEIQDANVRLKSETRPQRKGQKQQRQAYAPSRSRFRSPSEWSDRGECSWSSVDRIARRARLTRVCLGEGRDGMVRYDRKEVEAYEAQRRVHVQA